MKVTLKKQSTGQYKQVKIGFSWTLLIFSPCFGFPLFMRGLYALGALMASMWVIYIFVDMYFGGAAILLLQVWLGFSGNKLYAEKLFQDGYVIDNYESPEARLAMLKWNLSTPNIAAISENNIPDQKPTPVTVNSNVADEGHASPDATKSSDRKYLIEAIVGILILILVIGAVLYYLSPKDMSESGSAYSKWNDSTNRPGYPQNAESYLRDQNKGEEGAGVISNNFSCDCEKQRCVDISDNFAGDGYKPKLITLQGRKITKKGYHDYQGEFETPVLLLDKVTCFLGRQMLDGMDELSNVSYPAVSEVQMVINWSELPQEKKDIISSEDEIEVSGTMFPAFTMWHITPVLLSLEEVKATDAERDVIAKESPKPAIKAMKNVSGFIVGEPRAVYEPGDIKNHVILGDGTSVVVTGEVEDNGLYRLQVDGYSSPLFVPK
ncbi:hypothetical protein [uncultured Marivita sp.]|uniref:hypothetical protein n=1 Tax=uncultured Marivita sp. TaxID=888080 RepID=UPI00262AB759|nr:hypothetical protein [uncultured Marivita sp.]